LENLNIIKNKYKMLVVGKHEHNENAYKMLVGKPEHKRPLERPKHRGNIILKWILRKQIEDRGQ
jgi:hypothetical protein